MKRLTLVVLFIAVLSLQGFSQIKFPIEYRVEKQAMSTPMSLLEDVVFVHPYFTRPLNIQFDGSVLNMKYDNGEAFVNKNLTEVKKLTELDEDAIMFETFYYTDKSNVSDTIMFVVDHNIGYVEFVLPTKNSNGNNIGYTSYKKYVKDENLALN